MGSLQVYRLQQEKGALLVDCRVPWDFERQKIEGAISVPLWRGVAGKTTWDTIKRAVMAVGFAMKATGRVARSTSSEQCHDSSTFSSCIRSAQRSTIALKVLLVMQRETQLSSRPVKKSFPRTKRSLSTVAWGGPWTWVRCPTSLAASPSKTTQSACLAGSQGP